MAYYFKTSLYQQYSKDDRFPQVDQSIQSISSQNPGGIFFNGQAHSKMYIGKQEP